MNNILDRIRVQQNQPISAGSVGEYVAIEIARRLGDETNARADLGVASRFVVRQLASAYNHTRLERGAAAWESFKAALPAFHDLPSFRMPLLALRVTRRAISIAVFIGLQLEYRQTRELVGDEEGARRTAVGFIAGALARFPGTSVGIEYSGGEENSRQDRLRAALIECVRTAAFPLWDASTALLLASASLPPCRTRVQFRRVVERIWPDVAAQDTNRAVLDALGLGLFIQTQRLLDAGVGQAVPA